MTEEMTEVIPRWGLGDAGLAFVAGLAGSVLAVGVYVGVTGHESGVVFTAVGLIGLWVGFVGVALWASRNKGSGSLASDYGLSIRPRDIAQGVVVGLLAQLVLVNAIVQLFHLLSPSVDIGGQARDITGDTGGWRLAVLAPFLVIGAPLVEELYFRGLLQRSAIRRLGPVAGIVLPAVAFGLVHTSTDLSGWSLAALVTALAAFGAVLGVLAYRTGRLGPGLVAHATFNALTLIALALS
jgi:membrane protease YdiL (CAAX protease family)